MPQVACQRVDGALQGRRVIWIGIKGEPALVQRSIGDVIGKELYLAEVLRLGGVDIRHQLTLSGRPTAVLSIAGTDAVSRTS
jgi:hypothetical protein